MTADSEYPRLLVLAGFPPEKGGGGGVILRSLLQNYPADKIQWFTLTKFREHDIWWRPEVKRKSPTFGFRGMRFPLIKWLYGLGGVHVDSYLAAKSAMDVADSFQAEVCWGVLDCHVTFAIDQFMQKCKLPIHLSVHDDPFITAKISAYPVDANIVNKVFEQCFINADSRDCISQRMSDSYRNRLNVDSFVLTRGVEINRGEKTADLSAGLKILMGGDSLCTPPWPNNLLDALKILQETQNIPIEFHAFDKKLGKSGGFLHVHDMLPEPVFNNLLDTMNIGYAADPLTDLGRKFASTSLPTKVITYIGAGIPFLYHGPEDSTVGDLLKSYKAGIIIESQDSCVLANGFKQIINNYTYMHNECIKAATEYFDIHLLQQKIYGKLRNISSKG